MQRYVKMFRRLVSAGYSPAAAVVAIEAAFHPAPEVVTVLRSLV